MMSNHEPETTNEERERSRPLLISVAVCTHNRADLLRDVLADLCAQTLDGHEYEVLVVDNLSTDNTRAVVNEFSDRHANVRYVYEPNQGLSHARNRGWREANGEYVGYTDDDCRLPVGWLQAAAEVIRAGHPEVFGGPYYACYNTPKPRWYKDEYASQVQDAVPRLLTEGEFLSGGNIFLTRELLERMNGFDTTLGMAGHKVAYGEETDLIRRTRDAFPETRVHYDPRLHVQHLVRAEKMMLRWVARQRWVAGRSAFYAFGAQTHRSRRELSGYIMESVRRAFRDVLHMRSRDRQQYPYFQNYLYERVFHHFVIMGQLWAEWRESR